MVEIIAEGTAKQLAKNKNSLTGQYLAGKLKIAVPEQRMTPPNPENTIQLCGASGHNLKNVTLNLPLGVMTCITGVSGSGKSTLINRTLLPLAATELNGATTLTVEKYQSIDGLQHLDKVVDIDQSPIGRTPRSNPATYTGVFTPIRELFAQTPEAKARGYSAGRFSFNVKGGRCEACEGDGMIKVAMHFYLICMCLVMPVMANAITVKHWKSAIKARTFPMCST
jgi:excinuclease ABC subunit A